MDEKIRQLTEKNKEEIIAAGQKMAHLGLVQATWGNISARVAGENLVVISPSGMNYDQLTADDIVILNLDGSIVEGERKPSVEAPMHLAIYKTRADVGAIVHTHSVYSCAAAVARKPLPPILEEMAQMVGGSVEVASYALAGSNELAHNTVKALGNRNAVLLANHGLVGVANTVHEALKTCQVVEKAAQVFMLAAHLGHATSLSENDVKTLYRFYHEQYGQDR